MDTTFKKEQIQYVIIILFFHTKEVVMAPLKNNIKA